MNEPIVHDGEVYPDEEAFVAATHPDIPEEIKRIYVGPKAKEDKPAPDYDPDTAAGMALQATEKAADALKRAQGTKPTTDAQVGSVGLPDISEVSHQDWIEGMLKSAASGLTYPGDVYQGKASPDDPARAMDVAGTLMLGVPTAIAQKAEAGTIGTFGGIKSAKPLNKLSDLGHAQVLEADGIHPDIIHQQTGFFRGVDSRWRHEIDDSKAVFDENWLDKIPERPVWSKIQRDTNKYLPEVLDHPELYKAYPQLKDVQVEYDMYKQGAHWDVVNNKIVVGPKFNNKEVLMHEIQHAIQDIEGFAKGGAPGEAGKTYQLRLAQAAREQIYEPLKKLKDITDRTGIITKSEADEMNRLTALANKYIEYSKAGNAQAFENYLTLAGETESRNVSTRLPMTAKERRKLHPRWTEDIDPKEQRVADRVLVTDPYMP